MKRHTCIICKMKRYEINMKTVLERSWVCKDKNCHKHKDIPIGEEIIRLYKKLKIVCRPHLFNK